MVFMKLVPTKAILLLVTLTMFTTATFVIRAIRKCPIGADVEFGGLADLTFGAQGKKAVEFVS